MADVKYKVNKGVKNILKIFLDFFQSIGLSSNMFKGPNGAGKGDKPRPNSISKKEYDKRWDKIFRKDKSNANKQTKKTNKKRHTVSYSSH